MRVAILADIHGNLPAFEAALEHLAGQHVDELIIAGDIVVGAPDSAACWRLARSLGCPIVRGNHERYLAHYGTPNAAPEWESEQFAPLRWAVAQFIPAERQAIEQLPLALRGPDRPDLLIVHASARSDKDSVAAYTPDSELSTMFPAVRERLIVRAHNHVGQVRLWDDRMIVTAGSVGLPLDGSPTAQYLILDQRGDGWRVQHQSTPYDLEAVARRFRETDYLAAAGPIGRLFMREVATASHQLVPFLRAYARWSAQSPISLAEAVGRFLAA